ncbi:unnamed protein product [Effrenium voratum]|nr:unnamed protein product [Effrenium voratum]
MSKDGGGGLEPIMLPERSDLKAQWDRIHADWTALKAYQDTMSSEDASRMEAALLRLVAQIRAALPMYAQRDVKAPQSFPWPRIIYSIIGACLTCCCCTMVLYPWLKSYRKRTKLEAQAAVPQADDV